MSDNVRKSLPAPPFDQVDNRNGCRLISTDKQSARGFDIRDSSQYDGVVTVGEYVPTSVGANILDSTPTVVGVSVGQGTGKFTWGHRPPLLTRQTASMGVD